MFRHFAKEINRQLKIKNKIERDSYNEQMFERKANGIEVMTFEQWKKQNQEFRKLFEKDQEEKKNVKQTFQKNPKIHINNKRQVCSLFQDYFLG